MSKHVMATGVASSARQGQMTWVAHTFPIRKWQYSSALVASRNGLGKNLCTRRSQASRSGRSILTTGIPPAVLDADGKYACGPDGRRLSERSFSHHQHWLTIASKLD